MSQPNPKLREPQLEADISDLCPSSNNFHTGLTSTNFLPASTIASDTLPSITSLDEGFNNLSDTLQPLRHEQMNDKGLQRKQKSRQLPSPSSPPSVTSLSSIQVDRIAVHCPGSPSCSLPGVNQVKSGKRIVDANSIVIAPEVLERLRRWILGFAIVEFDLDDGPVVDAVIPSLFLLPQESNNIAFAAFPDSPQFEQGEQCHSFRVREQLTSENDKRPATEDGYIYGFSHFTQKRDESSKRGYRQHSVVILTQHQYPALFTTLINIFGPLFQKHGSPMLEVACHNIATWYDDLFYLCRAGPIMEKSRSDPKPGETLELGFLGTVVYVEIPHTIDQFQLTETSSFNEMYDPKLHVLASCVPFYPPPLLLFEACLSNLWSIWECLILCEPILVFGQSPTQTSQAVWWLRDLIRPIPLASDMRPYLTMQDSDLTILVNKLPPKAGLVIGVTNPFFEKSCAHWPHVLSLGKQTKTPSEKITRPKGGSYSDSIGPSPGWKTKTHKRYISKDHTLLRELETAARGDDRQKLWASFALRRHFFSRTTNLISPLARYVNTLIPSPQEVAQARSYRDMLRLKPFSPASFFASLKNNGRSLPFKSNTKRMQFYERWLKSPSFGVWLAHQESIVQDTLNPPVDLIVPPTAA